MQHLTRSTNRPLLICCANEWDRLAKQSVERDLAVLRAFQLRVTGAMFQDWVSWSHLQRQLRVIVGRLVKRRDRVYKKELVLLAHQLLLSWKRWVQMVACLARLKLLGKQQTVMDAFCAWAQGCGQDHSVEFTAHQFRDVMCNIMQQP
jgi:hypothetical protein